MKEGAAVESACCRDEVSERNVRNVWDGVSSESMYERCGMSGVG